ncbi:MAG: hypothetical protein L3J83_04460 [Proteobacteria bacterium]|nr:hypothetical protein [Pseudomonadota bacterium]
MKAEIRFQYYPAKATAMQPIGLTTLADFLLLHINDTKRSIFEQISKAEANGNKKRKAQLKQNNLKVFTPCVIIGNGKDGKPWKDYAHIEHFTGLAVLDFDHLPDTTTAEKFKQYLFKEYTCIIAIWLSPSKHGVKALVSIPVVSRVEDFKAYFWGLENEMKQYGDSNQRQWFDGSGQNPTLSLFQSYDPALLLAEEYTTWTKKGTKENIFKYNETPTPAPKINTSDKDRKTVLKSISTMFRNINQGTAGHPPLIKKCITIGGYVAAGYLTLLEAEQLIDWNIENHPYLCKGIKGYKKDARFGLNVGQLKPLIL